MRREIINYFNACYQADNRSLSLWDIYAKDVENRVIVFPDFYNYDPEFDSLRGKLKQDDAAEIEKKLETYKREKVFIYGHHLLTGEVEIAVGEVGKKTKKICAPLIICNASINDKDGYKALVIDQGSARINDEVFALLVSDRNKLFELDEAIENKKIFDIHWLYDWLQPNLAVGIKLENKSWASSERWVKLVYSESTTLGFSLLASSVLAITNRPRSSRGITNELESIATGSDLSPPLEQLFTRNRVKATSTIDCKLDNIPGLLSDAQRSALNNAAEKTFSMLVGPPGTGKSYTIACIVLERFMRGESVLVVSENEFAVDVVHEKLVEQLGLSSTAAIRAGKHEYHKHLKQYIRDLIAGIGLPKPELSQQNQLDKLRARIKQQENQFTTLANKAIKASALFEQAVHNPKSVGLFGRFRLWLHKRRLDKYGLLYDILEDIKDTQAQREVVLSKHINNTYFSKLRKILQKHRAELVKFSQALSARVSSKQESIFSEIEFSILLEAFPIWLCSLSALHQALPLRKNLFDLVIIDEATQVNIAACIPALYRAKRAVVIGDPKQLRHISFLSRQKQEGLKKSAGLDAYPHDLNYRDNSMIDFADQAIAAQDDIVMLDEHYRSLPEIIQFSNKTFYGGSLRIMTEKPVSSQNIPVEIIKINDGVRDNGVNKVEAAAIINRTRKIIQTQVDFPEQYKLSIGILSFFSDQAAYLQDLLINEFSIDEIAAHKLRAGTPYAFQGEERDIMLISCAVDDETPKATYTYLNRPDVFNVSITRARVQQLIFLSTENIPKDNLLNLFLESIRADRSKRNYINDQRDRNLNEIIRTLQSENIDVIRNYPIAGIPMDLVALHESHAIAIDLIGFPGEYEDALHLEHYKIFERAGLTIFPLTHVAWLFEKELVIAKLKQAFRDLVNKDIVKLSLKQISTHFGKLISISPELANKVKQLEFDLVDIGEKAGLMQLAELVDRYHTFIWILKQKLSEHELTFYRYSSISQEIVEKVLENLNSIVIMHKSLNKAKHNLDESNQEAGQQLLLEQQTAIQKIMTNNEKAILELEKISLSWSQVNTSTEHSEDSFDFVLKELARLRDRVEQYSSD